MRLIKFLSKANISSRREVEKLISFHHVKVNGRLASSPFQEIDPSRDRIFVRGKQVKMPSSFAYFLVHKPVGYICSNKRMGTQRLAVDLLQGRGRLFTVGRLDKDTSGLILITNDGDFAEAVSHPRNGIHKEYLVKTEEEITADHLKRLTEGTIIDRTLVKPISAKKMRRGTLKIVLGEGKKHEVRELVRHAGLTLTALSRIRIGSLHLGKMPPGDYRPLSIAEREELAPSLADNSEDISL